MSTKVTVTSLPKCDFCDKPAEYDGRLALGSWANMCERHWLALGVGQLGTGYGQRLVLIQPDTESSEPPRTWLDTLPEAKVSEALAKVNDTMLKQAGTDDKRFALWLHLADRVCVKRILVSIHDLSDWGWRDAYDSGMSPATAVTEALSEDDLYGGVEF